MVDVLINCIIGYILGFTIMLVIIDKRGLYFWRSNK